jgi:tetratricopeptide (TPR) repeat protein
VPIACQLPAIAMYKDPDLAQMLGHFVKRSGYNTGQLSQLSGVPKRTIANWLGGRVRRPRHSSDLLKLATVLHLDERETNELLQAAAHPPAPELLATIQDETSRELLAQVISNHRTTAPFQAIPDLPYFVGRDPEIRTLRKALLSGGQALIFSLQGMGGVGKTALAAHLAYQLRPYFRDGVLWARVDKAEPMSILSAFANAYGRDVSSFTDVASRSQVVREILANKRALIVLDNVQRSAEVKPLLPPSNGACAVIITTRHQNLDVTSGAYRFTIEPFNKEAGESTTLFAQILGNERVQREEATLVRIADLLGHLPLAVAIAASRMAYEPGWSAVEFLENLQQEQQRLDVLTYESQSVRLSTNVSYQMLPPDSRDFFAALGAFGLENLNVKAIAAVTEQSPETVRVTLRQLYGLSLAHIGHGKRYYLHPLIHDFAREQLELGQNRKDVLGRMIDFYAGYVDRCHHHYDELALDFDHILAAIEAAHNEGKLFELICIATDLHAFLETKGLYELAALHLGQAKVAADSLKDSVSLARVLLPMARLLRKQGESTKAKIVSEEGLALARQSNDKFFTSAFLGEIGVLLPCLGRASEAPAYYEEGLVLAREIGDPDLISTHLLHLGLFYGPATPEAEMYYEEGLTLARQTGDTMKTAKFLNNLGIVASNEGQLARAETYFRESLDLARAVSFQEVVGIALLNLGEMACLRQAYQEAEAYLEEAQTIAGQLGQKRLLRLTAQQLGKLASVQKQYKAAEAFYRQALVLAGESEDRLVAGNILLMLARVLIRCGAKAESDACFYESLDLARQGTNYRQQAGLLNGWGELFLQSGDHKAAATAYAEALALAQAGQVDKTVAEARDGLARARVLQP